MSRQPDYVLDLWEQVDKQFFESCREQGAKEMSEKKEDTAPEKEMSVAERLRGAIAHLERISSDNHEGLDFTEMYKLIKKFQDREAEEKEAENDHDTLLVVPDEEEDDGELAVQGFNEMRRAIDTINTKLREKREEDSEHHGKESVNGPIQGGNVDVQRMLSDHEALVEASHPKLEEIVVKNAYGHGPREPHLRNVKLTREQEVWYLTELTELGLTKEDGKYTFLGEKHSLGCPLCRSSTACKTQSHPTGIRVDCWKCGTFRIENDIANGGGYKNCEECGSSEHKTAGVQCILRSIVDSAGINPRWEPIRASEDDSTPKYVRYDPLYLSEDQLEGLEQLLEHLERGTLPSLDSRLSTVDEEPGVYEIDLEEGETLYRYRRGK